MTTTVIVPVYNGAKFVARCLNALAGQKKKPDEIIIVDDGSTDDSVRLVENTSVRIIRQSHQGPAAARNMGIQNAMGEIILFTDIDCEPHPSWVVEMQNSLEKPDISGVKGVYATKQKGIVPRLVQYEFEERYDLMERSPWIDFIDTYSAAFRRSILQEVGGFDAALIKNEDVDLSYRLADAGKKLVMNRNAIVYHHHPDSWPGYFTAKAKKAYWRTIVYRLHPAKAIKDTYTPQLLKIQIFLLIVALLGLIPVWKDPFYAWYDLILWGGLLFTTIPFTRRVMLKDPVLSIWAPLFLITRSLAFMIGIILGIFGLIIFKPGIERHRS